MNVALDTTAVYTSRAGAARYVRGLQRGFRELAAADLHMTPIAWEVENLAYGQPGRALKTAYREFVWAPWLAPGQIRASNADLFHSPSNWFVNPPAGLPHVVTLLDLALIRFPERFRPWLRHSGRKRLAQLPKAGKIICISRFTADEAMELLGLPAAKLEVVHLGNDFDQPPPHAPGRPKTLPETPFFLFVGSLEPGKNLRLLRAVYERAKDLKRNLPPLAIAGARWLGVAGEGTPPADWHYLGHVPDAELHWLYSHALALVFPTKYEGFGFPLLEAMGLGCPTVASPLASLPEIGGAATVWTEPTAAAYLDVLTELADNPSTRAVRAELGLREAKKFSWKRCAAETLEVYRSVS